MKSLKEILILSMTLSGPMICHSMIQLKDSYTYNALSKEQLLTSYIKKGDVAKLEMILFAEKYEQETLNEAIFSIIENKISSVDQEHMIKLIIDAGANINALNYRGNTALTLAVSKENIHIVSLLIKMKANVNLLNRGGCTSLMHAISYCREGLWGVTNKSKIWSNRVDIVKKLISNHALTDTQDLEGKTPLMIAVRWGLIDIVKLLLFYKVNIHTKDKDGRNALMYATECNFEERLEIVKLLEKEGATFNVPKKSVSIEHAQNKN